MRATFLANGINPDGWPLEDVWNAYGILVAMGWTVPPIKWVDELIEQAAAESFGGIG